MATPLKEDDFVRDEEDEEITEELCRSDMYQPPEPPHQMSAACVNSPRTILGYVWNEMSNIGTLVRGVFISSLPPKKNPWGKNPRVEVAVQCIMTEMGPVRWAVTSASVCGAIWVVTHQTFENHYGFRLSCFGLEDIHRT
ncbi:hypothetical protein DFS34DRAFT_596267 [Phlyctochytrium arcticum]|nr:hypothetical protein DFS34DRAFT_596267 [Phlyctochytrium arcticum]